MQNEMCLTDKYVFESFEWWPNWIQRAGNLRHRQEHNFDGKISVKMQYSDVAVFVVVKATGVKTNKLKKRFYIYDWNA